MTQRGHGLCHGVVTPGHVSEPGHVPAPGHGAEHVTTARGGERGGEHSQPEQRDLVVRCSQHSLDRYGQYFYFDNI